MRHESHSPCACWNCSKKLGQFEFPPEQIVQTDSQLESIVLKLNQKTSKMERQTDQLHLKFSVSREKILPRPSSNFTTLSVPSEKLLEESPRPSINS